jgi:hypothetical protein
LTAAAATGGAILLLATYAGRAGWGNLMTLAVAGAIGGAVYLAACQGLRVRELTRFIRAVIGRGG